MIKNVDHLYRLLPEKIFKKLSQYYYAIQHKLYKPFSESEFKDFLITQLGIIEGSTIFIHSSLDKLSLAFSPYRVLQILMETVGDQGTLLFPSWHYLGRAEDYLKSQRIFDVKRSPTVLGLLPELARRHYLAHRSLHPTASITAIGKHAEELTSKHHLDIYPCGEYSPMYLMMNHNARIIGLGEKVVSLSFVHCVEDIMKENFPFKTLTGNTIEGILKDENGKIRKINTYVPDKRIQNRNIQDYFDRNISLDICKRFKRGGVNFFICDAQPLFSRMKELASRGITIYENKRD
jgi:aminoglycoside N3'-acetyltransferase